MQKFVFTIRHKLVLAFGTWAILMLIIGMLAVDALCRHDGSGLFRYRLLSAVVVAASAFGCGVAIFCGLHLHRVVCGGLNRVVERFDVIATTLDLSMRTSSPRMDEFGRSAASFDRLMQRLADAVSTVRHSTDSVATVTREIAAGNFDLSRRTEEQAASLEETAASMTQLAETVKQNAANAVQANKLVANAKGIAHLGGDAVQTMVATIERIYGNSARISEITTVIEGIAFQTNILALNAAVEAARAGEQGRGFGVVASEVRNLAQRSAAAALEIKDVIGSSVAEIQNSSRQASDVSTSMGEITNAIGQVYEFVGDIAIASDEQSRGIEQVNQAVNHMDLVTQRNAALVEQVAAAA